MIPEFIPYLLRFFASLVVVYITGHIFCAFMDQNEMRSAARLFFKLTIGSLTLLIAYALFTTSGKSITLGIIPLLTVVVWKSKFSINQFRSNILTIEWKLIGYLLTAGLLLFFIQFRNVASYVIHPDFSFYAGVGDYMLRTGIESVNMDWVNTGLQAPVLYHYGDIWLPVALSSFLGITVLNTLVFIMLPLSMTIFYAGIVAFIGKQFGISDLKACLFVLLLPCLSVFQYFILNNFAFVGYSVHWLGSIYIQKFLFSGIAIIASVLAKDNWLQKTMPLFILCLLYTSAAPGIIIGLATWFIIRIIREKGKAHFRQAFMLLIFTFGYILLFYHITMIPNPYRIEAVSAATACLQNLKTTNGIMLVGANMLKRLLDLLLNIAPYLLLLLLFSKKQRNECLMLLKGNRHLVCILLVSALLSGFTWILVDSIQLQMVFSMPFLLLVFCIIIIYALRNLRGWRLIAPLLLIAGNVFFIQKNHTNGNRLDTKFYSQAIKDIRKGGNFAFVQSGESLMESNQFFRNANYMISFPDMRRYTDTYLPVNLTVYEIPYDMNNPADATYVVNALEESPFYRYVEKKALRKDLKEAQNQFIIENNIRFVVVQRGLNWFEGRPFQVEKVFHSNTESYDLYMIHYK